MRISCRLFLVAQIVAKIVVALWIVDWIYYFYLYFQQEKVLQVFMVFGYLPLAYLALYFLHNGIVLFLNNKKVKPLISEFLGLIISFITIPYFSLVHFYIDDILIISFIVSLVFFQLLIIFGEDCFSLSDEERYGGFINGEIVD